MERTYVMIKPDAVQRGLIGNVINRIENKGLKISALRMNVISEETATEHYSEHKERPFFPSLISYITSGPSVSMVIEGGDAVKIMRAINGATNPVEAAPGTIRGDFAIETGRNIVHASDSVESAEREIAIHFSEDEIAGYTKIDETCLYE
ncbi:nucleoside-diphosphate kinase [Methanohalophilus levihalophilus]|uniref:nucleoside-diphosphate kinase n=1 Tax=Methanohalophilus levihalophilus TaxID=1431282 RepID=UPI001AE10D9E|nr:nucleoside-diphosphate kinase [Methanohalophilus levihalophilus]MBP2029319.1 nucleoside-diphosphate kinase [Methanohalophilus levihalophilus]